MSNIALELHGEFMSVSRWQNKGKIIDFTVNYIGVYKDLLFFLLYQVYQGNIVE